MPGEPIAEAHVLILARLDRLEADMAKVRSTTTSTATHMERTFSSAFGNLRRVAATFGVAFGAAFAITKVKQFVGESMRSFGEEEEAINRVTAALRASGQLRAGSVDALRAYAAEIQRTTVYADEEVIAAGAQIASLARLSGDALPKATQAAIELASVTGKDLGSAAFLVAKALGGSTAALGRWGIKIKEGASQAEVLDAILKRVSGGMGIAQAAAETHGGQMKQLANRWDEVRESVGKTIVEELRAAGVIGKVSALMDEHGDALAQAARAGAQMAVALIEVTAKFTGLFNETSKVGGAVGGVLEAIDKVVLGIGDRIYELIRAIQKAIKFVRDLEFGLSKAEAARMGVPGEVLPMVTGKGAVDVGELLAKGGVEGMGAPTAPAIAAAAAGGPGEFTKRMEEARRLKRVQRDLDEAQRRFEERQAEITAEAVEPMVLEFDVDTDKAQAAVQKLGDTLRAARHETEDLRLGMELRGAPEAVAEATKEVMRLQHAIEDVEASELPTAAKRERVAVLREMQDAERGRLELAIVGSRVSDERLAKANRIYSRETDIERMQRAQVEAGEEQLDLQGSILAGAAEREGIEDLTAYHAEKKAALDAEAATALQAEVAQLQQVAQLVASMTAGMDGFAKTLGQGVAAAFNLAGALKQAKGNADAVRDAWIAAAATIGPLVAQMGGIGETLGGGISGAASGAAIGAQFGGAGAPIGAAAGFIAGVVGSLFGDAKEEAERHASAMNKLSGAAERMRKVFEETTDASRAQVEALRQARDLFKTTELGAFEGGTVGLDPELKRLMLTAGMTEDEIRSLRAAMNDAREAGIDPVKFAVDYLTSALGPLESQLRAAADAAGAFLEERRFDLADVEDPRAQLLDALARPPEELAGVELPTELPTTAAGLEEVQQRFQQILADIHAGVLEVSPATEQWLEMVTSGADALGDAARAAEDAFNSLRDSLSDASAVAELLGVSAQETFAELGPRIAEQFPQFAEMLFGPDLLANAAEIQANLTSIFDVFLHGTDAQIAAAEIMLQVMGLTKAEALEIAGIVKSAAEASAGAAVATVQAVSSGASAEFRRYSNDMQREWGKARQRMGTEWEGITFGAYSQIRAMTSAIGGISEGGFAQREIMDMVRRTGESRMEYGARGEEFLEMAKLERAYLMEQRLGESNEERRERIQAYKEMAQRFSGSVAEWMQEVQGLLKREEFEAEHGRGAFGPAARHEAPLTGASRVIEVSEASLVGTFNSIMLNTGETATNTRKMVALMESAPPAPLTRTASFTDPAEIARLAQQELSTRIR